MKDNALSNQAAYIRVVLADTFTRAYNFIFFIFHQKETWLFLTAISICVLICKVWSKHQQKRKRLLTYKLRNKLKKSCKQEKKYLLASCIERLYLPSLQSVIFIIFIFGVFYKLSHDPKLNGGSSLQFDDSNHYQNLITIYAGIGAIIFALLIFVAESSRDDETKDRGRVLLRESLLFPLAVAEIVGFFVFIWGDVNAWAILPLAAIAIMTIYSLGKLLSILLSRSLFAQKRLQLLKDQIKRSIDMAISERFGNSILLRSLGEGKVELDYNPLFSNADDEITSHFFYSDKMGIITDIKLDKLDEFAKLVEKEANGKGFSFYKDKAKQESFQASNAVKTAKTDAAVFQQTDRQLLHKKFRDEVDEENHILISIDKRTVDNPDMLKRLGRLAREAFVIKKKNNNFSEEIKLEIDGLKDQFITAIRDKKLGKTEEIIKTYISLSEAFLEALNTCGGGYSYEQAREERSSIVGGWNEIQWLSDSIRESYLEAAQSHDQEIIRNVAYLPIAIAIRAIKAGDQYVYQEFIKFPVFLYHLALKEDNQDLREFMIGRSWRHLKDMSDYYIEHPLKHKADDADAVKKYWDFTVPVFTAFQSLLKTAFDKRDAESFKIFLDKFSGLFHDFYPSRGYPNARYYRDSLGWTKNSSEREDIRRKIDILEQKEKAAEDIQAKKSQLVFGLSAWIFEQYRKQQSDSLIARFYFPIADKLPNSLPKLTRIYISSRQSEDFWAWDDWEIIPDGEVHSIDFDSKLNRLYCVRALHIMRDMSQEAIDAIVLPHSRDLAFLAEERLDSHNLASILNAIAESSAQWSFILTPSAIGKIPSFKKLLAKAKVAQEKSEEEYLKEVKIDKGRLEEFKSKVKESFYQSVCLRSIMARLGAYEDLVVEVPGNKIPSLGYNQVDEKAAFIKDWHVHYSGWGENYGRGMANSEDQLILEKIVARGRNKKNVSKQDMISQIEDSLKEIRFENPVILHTLEWPDEYELVRTFKGFTPKHSKDCPKSELDDIQCYKGMIKINGSQIPVIHIFPRDPKLKNKVTILDFAKFGMLKQYSPIDDPSDIGCQYDVFLMRVIDLNGASERRQKIISEKPAWLKDQTDKEGYLKQKVLINIYQKLEFEIVDDGFACCISITDAEEA